MTNRAIDDFITYSNGHTAQANAQREQIKTSINVQKATFRMRSFANIVKQDSQKFNQDRFNIYNPNAYSAIITGSTYAGLDELENGMSLDAAASDFVNDADGVRVGVTMATAAGIGRTEDEKEKNSIAQVASACVKYYVDQTCNAQTLEQFNSNDETAKANLTQLYLDAAAQADKFREKNDDGFYNAVVSISTTTLMSSPEYTNKALLGNIGNGVVLIFDCSTGALKHQLNAHDIELSSGKNVADSPYSIQSLGTDNTDLVDFLLPESDIEIGDTIVHLSEGIWRELSADISTDIKLETTLFLGDTLLKAQQLHEKAIAHALEQRTIRHKLLEKAKPYFDAAKTKTFTDRSEYERYDTQALFAQINDKDEQLAQELQDLVENNQSNGFAYDPSQPAIEFIRYIQQQFPGNWATISVMTVPHNDVELVRALVLHPENTTNLLRRIRQRLEQTYNMAFTIEHFREYMEKALDSIAREKYYSTHTHPKGVRYKIDEHGQLTPAPQLIYNRDYFDKIVTLLEHCASPYEVGFALLSRAIEQSQGHGANKLKNAELITNYLITVDDLNILAQLFDRVDDLKAIYVNQHKYPNFDFYRRAENTQCWKNMIKLLRNHALKVKDHTLEGCKTYHEKNALLCWAQRQAIFSEHRHNYFFLGAFGRTSAKRALQSQLRQITKVSLAPKR